KMNTQLSTCCLFVALLCGFVAGTTVSLNETDCPLMCPSIYKPVCGSDGFNLKEFASSCNLKASNCRRERNALTTYAETDMAWCSSERVENLLEKLGNIKLDIAECLKPCSMIYQPICVTNGKYRGLVSNECTLANYNCALRASGFEATQLLRFLRSDSC
ncbi:hypothetical protein KR222_009481, partial [Zaprionus bogoriensis]